MESEYSLPCSQDPM